MHRQNIRVYPEAVDDPNTPHCPHGKVLIIKNVHYRSMAKSKLHIQDHAYSFHGILKEKIKTKNILLVRPAEIERIATFLGGLIKLVGRQG